MDSDKVIGFVRGVAYAAAMMKKYSINSDQLLKESGISKVDLLNHADEYDLKILGFIEEDC
ncbi:hypothetical protein MKY29_02930 [Psychrobacillus sp. FSL K6-2365]|uniref:hypothetical protein n=1 Tax=Psychrobacillus sp. FSL K6-2365 TaxID=2921546 RepID=UPI0030F9327F